MNKKFLAIAISLFAVFGLFSACQVLANNVSGWAWSNMKRPAGHPGGSHDPTIGWISFNSTNCDADGNGFSDGVLGCPPAGTPISNYGVNIVRDPDNPAIGNFSGFAWSANIGWINFAPADPFPALPNHSARVRLIDPGAGNVSGWARACAVFETGCSGTLNPNRGGWDGWIRLRGTTTGGTPYGVSISTTTGEFSGWAWSNMVIGWISFNDRDFDGLPGPVDYQVITDPNLFNQPPSVINLSVTQGNYCDAVSPPVFLNWQFSDPNPGHTQSAYQVQVADNPHFISPVKRDSGKVSRHALPGELQSWPPPNLSFATTYFWRVRVWDNHNATSAWATGTSFTTDRRHPSPNFTWSPPSPTVNELIQFTGASTCYGANNAMAPCASWSWDFNNDGIIDSTFQSPTTTFATHGNFRVTLGATDGAGNACSRSQTLNVRLPLPEWREVLPTPILWWEKILANISNLLGIDD